MKALCWHGKGDIRCDTVPDPELVASNIAAAQPEAASAFYGGVLGLEVVMDHGWIMTFAAAPVLVAPQISIASEGGSGTPVPDLSIEVDDLDDVLDRAKAAGHTIENGPPREPWGVRRFYVRDPFGRLVNVLTHSPDEPIESGPQ